MGNVGLLASAVPITAPGSPRRRQGRRRERLQAKLEQVLAEQLPDAVSSNLPARNSRLMKKRLAGLMISALLVPTAYAQPSSEPATTALSGQADAEKFLVFFDMNETTLTPDATQAVNAAAEEYHRTGAARIVVTGHTDILGSAAYNLQLSRRRAEEVANELIRAWVPATDITAVGRGENDLLLPTPDGVPEPRNRRVEIVVPPPLPPVPVAEAAPPEEEPGPFAFTIGPLSGHNFGETDDDGENDLAGAQLTFNVLPGFLGGVALKQGLLWIFNGDDGFTGRSVAALELAPDLGIVRPILGANFGGVYGKGVQDGLVAGPEIGLDLTLLEGFAMRVLVAYDYQFRNPGDWDEGILWGGLNFGARL